jgi:hypothetical protein
MAKEAAAAAAASSAAGSSALAHQTTPVGLLAPLPALPQVGMHERGWACTNGRHALPHES